LTTKKPRKSLGDTLANNFVYGDNAPIPPAEPVVEQVEPIANAAAREPEVPSSVERDSGAVVWAGSPPIQLRQDKTDGKPCVKTVETLEERVEPMVKAAATEQTSALISPQPTTSLMSRLMQNTSEKEPTVRLTVDLPQSTHKKLSILCANTGMKKVEVVRMLLDDALKDTNT
jgi:hypothetical protein